MRITKGRCRRCRSVQSEGWGISPFGIPPVWPRPARRVCVAFSAGGIIKPEWVKSMARDAIVFPCANPVPEIWPWEAKEAGACIVATGRSDFPNQVNNSLVFPGIFRGVLDVRARAITDEMAIAAAHELALCAKERGIQEDSILPKMDEWQVPMRLAVATATKAQEQGLATVARSRDQVHILAESKIRFAHETMRVLLREGLIVAPLAVRE